MKRRRKQINKKKERIVLSEVLPFEVPITFSNRHFYNFLTKNEVAVSGNTISWGNPDPSFEIIIKLLFGFDKNMHVDNQRIEINQGEFKTIPFNYKISHKDKDFRELTIIHPKNQLAVIEFYDKYKELILYYCNISPFSIRKPHKVAKFTYYKDRTHIEKLAYDHEHKIVEEFDKEYENLKTFFAYKDFSNVYKFYESYRYHRCEKKYNKMIKFDISRCFDSIYSHSITWALMNKEIVKDKISLSKKTFGGQFDSLMQNLNYAETNGIIIGPEFSRIFAELIMQKIDLNVFHKLKKKDLFFKKDYEIFRYIDDFFVFYNEDNHKDKILNEYRHQLKEYKLFLNDSKTKTFEKPIITEITIAKLNISDLLNDNLDFKVYEKTKEKESNENDEIEKKYSFYISANKLITRFKTIIKEAKIPYKDVLNYTLACIDRKTVRLIKIYSDIEDKEDKGEQEGKVTKAILELLDFTFFIYCASPRVNTTIKLCLILSKLIKFAKLKGNFNNDNKHLILKKIYDDISLVLWKNKNSEYTQVETLYLLIALKELGREYRLDETVLCEYFQVNLDNGTCEYNLNYFSISVLVFYIENKVRYNKFKDVLKEHIKNKFEMVSEEKRLKTTELTILLFDLLSSPFIDGGFKSELLDFYKITDKIEQNQVVDEEEHWFAKWDNFDFVKELEAKRSQEVY